MSNVVELKAPQPRRLSRQQFLEKARAMVDRGEIMVSRHLARDHPERAISQAMIERCIQRGTCQCDPYINGYGNWQSEIFRHLAGQELTVVAAIEWETQVIVITAY